VVWRFGLYNCQLGLLVREMGIFKYIIHRNSEGEVVGHNMATLMVDVNDFNSPGITTTEVTEEEYNMEVSGYTERRRIHGNRS